MAPHRAGEVALGSLDLRVPRNARPAPVPRNQFPAEPMSRGSGDRVHTRFYMADSAFEHSHESNAMRASGKSARKQFSTKHKSDTS